MEPIQDEGLLKDDFLKYLKATATKVNVDQWVALTLKKTSAQQTMNRTYRRQYSQTIYPTGCEYLEHRRIVNNLQEIIRF